jgi:hypothetical protein
LLPWMIHGDLAVSEFLQTTTPVGVQGVVGPRG